MTGISEIVSIREKIKEVQNPIRFEHTLGVAYTAACLAFMNNVDPLKAELAGLLHDCAKCYSNEELIAMCHRDNVRLTEEEIQAPKVIHAKYGRYLAEHKYGIKDEEILNSIESHTTGRPYMSTLEKIIFTADYIEPLRDEAKSLPELRKLAFRDLDECVFRILSQTVDYLNDKGVKIVSATINAFEWYQKERTL